jgi:transposase InsO family protein
MMAATFRTCSAARVRNPLWGAPRIHGELLKLGIEIAHPGCRRRPSGFCLSSFGRSPGSAAHDVEHAITFPWDQGCRYLLRDRDAIYGDDWVEMTKGLGIEEVITAPRSPWQNPFVERLIGSVRRECLDHMIVWNERSLRRTLRSYFAYYQESRTHLALAKDAPESRAVEKPERGRIVVIPQVGGLRYRYQRHAALELVGPRRRWLPFVL